MNLHPRFATSRQSGFTLIEVMIVVAIVAILSMVAYPAYTDYIIRGNIPNATAGLATKQVQMEQFFQDNRTYVGSDAAGTSLPCAADTTNKYFNFSCTGAGTPSATGFVISAAGKGNMAGFTYTIDQAGNKTTAAVPAGWSQPSPNTCWATKKGGIC